MPLDLPLIAERLPLFVQPTFWKCFALARRTPPLRAYLARDDLAPLSIREIAVTFHLTRSTCHRHVAELIDRRVLVRDLAGWFLMPLILDIERRHNARTDDTTTAPPTMGESDAPQQVALTWPVPPQDENGPPVGQRLLGFRSADVETLRGVDMQEPGENPGPSLLGDAMGALPASIHSPDVRYLLAKLAQTTPAWRGFPSAARDVALVERLEATTCRALLSALEQETLSPTAKNPGAWLARTVAAISMAQEIAS